MPSIDEIIAATLAPDPRICSRCGKAIIVPETIAADRFGVCEACYRRAQADASDQFADELKAKREYAAARKRKSRAKMDCGIRRKALTGEKW